MTTRKQTSLLPLLLIVSAAVIVAQIIWHIQARQKLLESQRGLEECLSQSRGLSQAYKDSQQALHEQAEIALSEWARATDLAETNNALLKELNWYERVNSVVTLGGAKGLMLTTPEKRVVWFETVSGTNEPIMQLDMMRKIVEQMDKKAPPKPVLSFMYPPKWMLRDLVRTNAVLCVRR